MVALLLTVASGGGADPGSDEISSSCRGGAGGGGFGVTVRRGGEIVRWHVPTFFSEPEEVPMRSNAEMSRDLFEELSEIGFAGIEYEKKGDMTCTLSLRSRAGMHAVSWPMGDPNAPTRLRDIARRIRHLVDIPANTSVRPDPSAE